MRAESRPPASRCSTLLACLVAWAVTSKSQHRKDRYGPIRPFILPLRNAGPVAVADVDGWDRTGSVSTSECSECMRGDGGGGIPLLLRRLVRDLKP